jgi:hypothetical protein
MPLAGDYMDQAKQGTVYVAESVLQFGDVGADQVREEIEDALVVGSMLSASERDYTEGVVTAAKRARNDVRWIAPFETANDRYGIIADLLTLLW